MTTLLAYLLTNLLTYSPLVDHVNNEISILGMLQMTGQENAKQSVKVSLLLLFFKPAYCLEKNTIQSTLFGASCGTKNSHTSEWTSSNKYYFKIRRGIFLR